MSVGSWLAALALTAAAAGPAAAGEHHDCTCRYKGQHLDLGSQVCLATPNGPRIAQCILVVNVTSWDFSSESCAVASIAQPVR